VEALSRDISTQSPNCEKDRDSPDTNRKRKKSGSSTGSFGSLRGSLDGRCSIPSFHPPSIMRAMATFVSHPFAVEAQAPKSEWF
jgi:hypothetical protein